MATINSVSGPLDTSQLGYTLMHEHVCSWSAGMWHYWPQFMGGRETFLEHASGVLAEAKAAGIQSFIDVTTIDLGRDIRLIAEAAKRSGMQIVACTGHWLDPSESMKNRTAEELAEFFTMEITEGIEGTDIKAGIIKVANDEPGLTDFGRSVLKAAAAAQKATGVPISTHSGAKIRIGEAQARILEREGVDPSRVYIGHSDDTDSLGYLTGLLERGYWIGLDRIPLGAFYPPPTVAERAGVVVELVNRGFEKQICLSHDVPIGLGLVGKEQEAKFRERIPGGILFINQTFIPMLKERGLSESSIEQIMIGNPRKFFEG